MLQRSQENSIAKRILIAMQIMALATMLTGCEKAVQKQPVSVRGNDATSHNEGEVPGWSGWSYGNIEKPELGDLSTPIFSAPAGTYKESVWVEVVGKGTSYSTGVTTDGNNPNRETAGIYRQIIHIEKTTTVKAQNFGPNGEQSPIATAVYIILEPDSNNIK